MSDNHLSLEDRLTKAKIYLITNEPWFGQLSCYLNFIPNDRVSSMAVDARGNVYYNPEWTEKLESAEIRGVLCHEILHLALRHLERTDTANPQLFNVAADLKVNLEIPGNHNISLPEGGLRVNYEGSWSTQTPEGSVTIEEIKNKTTEQIYYELRKKLKDKLPKDYQGDLIFSSGNLTQEEKEALEKMGITPVEKGDVARLGREWQSRVYSAAQTAKGNVPGGVAREIFKLENSEVPWTHILKDRMRRLSIKHSWKKPSGRYMPWYFPGRVKSSGIKLVAAIDTSGSMSKEQITKAISELYGLMQAFKFIDLYVMDCDAEVHDAKKIRRDQLSAMLLKGGGGTDFNPVFKWIKKNLNNNIDSLVFFTDLYGDFPKDKPPYETFWVTDTQNQDVPFGRKLILRSETD
jgi:predicted metal-dependent peptidase